MKDEMIRDAKNLGVYIHSRMNEILVTSAPVTTAPVATAVEALDCALTSEFINNPHNVYNDLTFVATTDDGIYYDSNFKLDEAVIEMEDYGAAYFDSTVSAYDK